MNDTQITSLIQEKWKQDYCPLVEGITFADGNILIMRSELVLEDGGGCEVRVRPIAQSNLSSFMAYNPDWWSSIGRWANAIWEAEELKAYCGEGSKGSDGFVALCNFTGDELRWVAFFENSNPFDQVRFAPPNLVAVSTYGHVWTFPLADPGQVTIKTG